MTFTIGRGNDIVSFFLSFLSFCDPSGVVGEICRGVQGERDFVLNVGLSSDRGGRGSPREQGGRVAVCRYGESMGLPRR
jgi:hypothetical protein